MKTVHLRNKAGEFCTLGEFCSECPRAYVDWVNSPRMAVEKLPEMRESLVKMRRLVEVIKAFGLNSAVGTSGPGVNITADGRYYTSSDTLGAEVRVAESRVQDAEEMACKWSKTGYEIGDE